MNLRSVMKLGTGVRRREIRGAEKRKRGCGEEKTLYFGATVLMA